MVERRAEEEIVHAWITLLEMLYLCLTEATTKKLAALANQPIDQTRRDLNSLRKKGLVQSRKEGRQLLWYLHSPQGGQHAFWKNGKVVVNQAKLRKIVAKARKRKGVDARCWKSVSLGKKAYAKQVPGALINWDKADNIIQSWRGAPKNLRLKLASGCGSTAVWNCGCTKSVSWRGEETLTECGLPVCYRLLEQGKMQTKPAPRGSRAKKVAWSKDPIRESQCWLLATAPKGKKPGDVYRLTCGCILCVSKVIGSSGSQDRVMGVVGPDRGKIICSKHKTQQGIYHRPVW